MGHWDDIRRQARQRRAEYLAAVPSGDAAALVAAVEAATGVRRVGVPAGDSLLDGGAAVLDREAGVVWFNADADPYQIVFYQAHEYGHLWLHDGPAHCRAADIDPEASEADLP